MKTIPKRLRRLLVSILAGLSLLGTSGCGTFDGMSWQEQYQATKDLANERNYWFPLKPERVQQDNGELPGQ
jgi:hypothetical protein